MTQCSFRYPSSQCTSKVIHSKFIVKDNILRQEHGCHWHEPKGFLTEEEAWAAIVEAVLNKDSSHASMHS